MAEQDDPFESFRQDLVRQDPAGEEEPSEDLYLRTPAASPGDELTWGAGDRDDSDSGLLYDPLDSGVPQSGPAPADNSSLLFRLALSTAALLVMFVLARGFWWPGEEPRGDPPKWAAAPNLPVAPPAAEPSSAQPVTAAKSQPDPRPESRKPEPVMVEEVAPKPVPPKPERPKPAEPKPVPVKPAAPRETEKAAALPEPSAVAEPAPLAQTRRAPQPWEEGPQPSDLLKPGPGVEAPVPLDFPRYSYPSAARGTGLRLDVKLALLVDERGRVIDARVREGDPPDLGFAETAIAVARRIPFQPASRYDIPGKMWTEVILEFVE